MKLFITSMVILVLIIGGGLWYIRTIAAITGDMLLCLDQAEAAAANEDYTAALQSISRMGEIWNAKKPLMSMFSDHSQLMDIDLSIAQIRQYATSAQSGDIYAEAAVLREYLSQIASADRLSWENVL